MKTALLVGILLLGVLVACSFSTRTEWHQLTQDYTFEQYLKEYNKEYNNRLEYHSRKSIFVNNLLTILKHNSDATSTWKMGVSHLTDLSVEEFKKMLGGRLLFEENTPELKEIRTKYQIQYQPTTNNNVQLPSSVDWRSSNIITAVKDQGQCGSCWTFGTTETIESYWANATGQLTDLSEQQILDCTPNPQQCGGTGGCGGGTPELAYAQIIADGKGMVTEWQYPYISYFGTPGQCRNKNSLPSPLAKIKGYVKLPANEQAPILSHVANVGPLAVNVEAVSWQHYASGIFNGCNNTNPDIDHVVQLVGYGPGYYLIRNSWSPSWGEKGYIKLYMGSAERCGTDLNPQDGTGCKGGPKTVQVCGTCGLWYDTSFPIVQKD